MRKGRVLEMVNEIRASELKPRSKVELEGALKYELPGQYRQELYGSDGVMEADSVSPCSSSSSPGKKKDRSLERVECRRSSEVLLRMK